MENNVWMTDAEYGLVTSKVPIVCVDLVISRRGKRVSEDYWNNADILLIKRKTDYERGKWCLIGGRQRKGENLRYCIQRHASDLEIEVEPVYPFDPNFPAWVNDADQDRTKHPTALVYPVEITKGNPRQEGEEFDGINWFPVDSLPEIMGYDHTREVLKTIGQLRKFNAKLKH